MSEICECGHEEGMHGPLLRDCYFPECPCKKFKAKNHSPLTNPELDSVSRIDEDTLRGSVKKDKK